MRPYLFYCGDLCNLGDLALLLQNLEQMPAGRHGYVRRWAVLPPEIAAQVAAAGGTLVDSRRWLAFVRLAMRCDVVIGGGQLVRDNVSLASLAAQYAGAVAARLGGGIVATRGLGVGAIRDRRRRWLWRALLRLAPIVRVRDDRSAIHAAALVGHDRVVLTADMAFLAGGLHIAARPCGELRDRIVIAPCIDASEGRSMSGALVARIVDAARAHLPGDALVFACHDPRPGMDRAAVEAMGDLPGLSVARMVDGYALDALLAEYRGASLVVTNRLHAVIFGLLADCPILVVVDGTAKTQFIAARFGLPMIDPGDSARIEEAVAHALQHLPGARRDALKAVAAAARANLPLSKRDQTFGM